jgi:hypothetical protein
VGQQEKAISDLKKALELGLALNAKQITEELLEDLEQ